MVAWSRILYNQDVVVTLNTNGTHPRSTAVALDPRFHPEGSTMTVLYNGDWSDAEQQIPPSTQTVPVTHVNGISTIRIDLPPAGMVILE